jgi:hypothetical protein
MVTLRWPTRQGSKTVVGYLSGAKADAAKQEIWVNPYIGDNARRWTTEWIKAHLKHCKRWCGRCRDVRRRLRSKTR